MKKIFNRRKASILQKIFVPLLIFFIILFVSFVYTFGKMLDKEVENNFNNEVERISIEIDKHNSELKNKATILATSLAFSPTVIKSFESYYTTYQLDSSTKEINKYIKNITNSYEENLGEAMRIHFYSIPAISFYRSWSENKGDDLTSSRHSIKEVFESESFVSGIESDEEGFIIRAIHPVFHENSTLLGSVEVYYPFSEISKNISLFEKYNNNILMHNTVKKESYTSFLPATKSFVFTNNEIDRINYSLANDDSLKKALVNPVSFMGENSGFLLKPIYNYKNEVEGVFAIEMDFTEIISHYKDLKITTSLIVGIGLAVLFLLFLYQTSTLIYKPMINIIKMLEGLAKGVHNRRMKIKSNTEIAKLKRAINSINENLINVEFFAHEIGEGKLDTNFSPRSSKDSLANTLNGMREKLKKSQREAEEQRNIERIREWQTKGIAEINNILRMHANNKEELFYHVIGNLVRYIDANQGGVFIIDESNEFLLLEGCYAYDRNKYLQKKSHIKEGLIGRCYQEKEPINLNNVPDNYLKIVSAVGEKSPNYLLLVPIIHDEVVKGVIEIASFTEFIEHIVAFVSEVANQLSMALNDLEYSTKTKILLDESMEKEQKLVQQEEEMRQNMEEMKATQEEFERREKELVQKIEKLQNRNY